METAATIAPRLRRFLFEMTGDTQLTEDTDLLGFGLLDFQTLMDLADFIETEYHQRMTVGQLAPVHFRSIRSIAALVEHLLKSGRSQAA